MRSPKKRSLNRTGMVEKPLNDRDKVPAERDHQVKEAARAADLRCAYESRRRRTRSQKIGSDRRPKPTPPTGPRPARHSDGLRCVVHNVEPDVNERGTPIVTFGYLDQSKATNARPLIEKAIVDAALIAAAGAHE